MKYKRILVIILLITSLLVGFSYYEARAAGPILKLDEEVRRFVKSTDEGWVDNTMSNITRTGSTSLLIPIVASIPNYELRMDALTGFLASHTVTETLKRVTGKTRPRSEERKYEPFSGNMSFPSGHAAGTFAIATAIAEHYPEYRRYAYAWSTLVAISRLYEDAHWFSDVVVGSAVGHYTTKWTMDLIEW
ncbi:phosphatase PAP2 family protein [Fuchsiella alkaliacetigena]|uniref:phosphatase PAP2 family protein n=1 Tax=Fuchsiella alkaliacetigena TaxID=957042 RepID=UPI00200A3040|nr:phosphatase PAP2 family protein [Fuchsiella alkaliacetigena]MCK8824309.1 phosphatase PAP2 family protein [Fuchsiella alkaliacetigena]